MSDEKKSRFGIFKLLAVVVVLLLAAIIALPFLIDANQFRPKLETEISGALRREVKIGNLKLSIFSGSVVADDLSIADDPAFSKAPFVKAKSLQVGVELKPLIASRQVRVTQISLDGPEINLIHANNGEWNFSSLGASEKAAAPSKTNPAASETSGADVTVGLLKVTNGRINVMRGMGNAKPRTYDKVEIQARDLSFTSVIPFTVSAALPGGGSFKMEGKAGPMNRTDLSLTPFTSTVALTHLDVIASGFIDTGSGLAGVLDFSGDLSSNGRQMQSKGRAKAERLQLVKGGAPAGRPVSLDYDANFDLKSQSGNVRNTKVEFGKAVARLDGTYVTRGESTVLKMRLRGDNVPAEDLEAMLPAVGVTLPKGAALKGGTLNADLLAEGPVEKLTITGPIGIANTRLEGFDLAGKMATVAKLAGIQSSAITEIEKFASDLRVVPDGIQASNLLLIVPALGQLSGNGAVGANNSLDFKMLANLKSSGGVVGSLSQLAGMRSKSDVGIPFFIRGTTSDPKFVPDVKGAATSLLDSALQGKGDKTGTSGQNPSLGDTLRGLFNKKKNP